MNILVFMGLPNINKARTYILPLLKVSKIKKIFIVRDTSFSNHPKLTFICPPKIFLKNSILKTLYKILLSLKIILKNNIDILYGIQMFPHGIISWFLSKILKKKNIFAVISGDGAIYSLGKIFSIIASKVIKGFDFLLLEGLTNKITTDSETPSFLKNLNITKEKILPGYSSCFLENFYPMNIEKKWDLITVSRLHKIKRIDLFIDIVKELSVKRKLRCLIIGDGPLCLELKEKVKLENLQENITFKGDLPTDKLNEYYNQSNIFLLTSKNEGLPATLIEAMVSEICVISTNVGTISTLIINKVNGFLFSFKQIHKSYKLINNLLDDEDYRKNIALKGRQTALTYSAWNRTDIWNELVEKWGN